jgi:hypothetical protein
VRERERERERERRGAHHFAVGAHDRDAVALLAAWRTRRIGERRRWRRRLARPAEIVVADQTAVARRRRFVTPVVFVFVCCVRERERERGRERERERCV